MWATGIVLLTTSPAPEVGSSVGLHCLCCKVPLQVCKEQMGGSCFQRGEVHIKVATGLSHAYSLPSFYLCPRAGSSLCPCQWVQCKAVGVGYPESHLLFQGDPRATKTPSFCFCISCLFLTYPYLVFCLSLAKREWDSNPSGHPSFCLTSWHFSHLGSCRCGWGRIAIIPLLQVQILGCIWKLLELLHLWQVAMCSLLLANTSWASLQGCGWSLQVHGLLPNCFVVALPRCHCFCLLTASRGELLTCCLKSHGVWMEELISFHGERVCTINKEQRELFQASSMWSNRETIGYSLTHSLLEMTEVECFLV